MSFGESMFSAGFNQKTVKEDLVVKANHTFLRQYLLGKTLENTRRLSTEEYHKGLPSGASWPYLQAGQPMGSMAQCLLRMSILHRLLDCIYTVLFSRFDPRAQN
jgi:hypothetical protein